MLQVKQSLNFLLKIFLCHFKHNSAPLGIPEIALEYKGI